MRPAASEAVPGWLGSVFGPRREGLETGVRRRTPATRTPPTGRRCFFSSVYEDRAAAPGEKRWKTLRRVTQDGPEADEIPAPSAIIVGSDNQRNGVAR